MSVDIKGLLQNLPRSLKKLKPCLSRAREVESKFPVVAYYCCKYAAELAAEIHQKKPLGPDGIAIFTDLLGGLEKAKASVGQDAAEGQKQVFNLAAKIFQKADDTYRAGLADKKTSRSFYAAGIFFTVLKQFGPLDPKISGLMKYSLLSSTKILRAIRNGEPVSPPDTQDESNNSLPIPGSSQSAGASMQRTPVSLADSTGGDDELMIPTFGDTSSSGSKVAPTAVPAASAFVIPAAPGFEDDAASSMVIPAAPGFEDDATIGGFVIPAAPGFEDDAASGLVIPAAPGFEDGAASGFVIPAAPGFEDDAASGLVIPAAPGFEDPAPVPVVDSLAILRHEADELVKAKRFKQGQNKYVALLDSLMAKMKVVQTEEKRAEFYAKINVLMKLAEGVRKKVESIPKALARTKVQSLLALSKRPSLSKGVQLVDKALAYDKEQCYLDAYNMYTESLSQLIPAMQSEKDATVRKIIYNNLAGIMGRAEILKKNLF